MGNLPLDYTAQHQARNHGVPTIELPVMAPLQAALEQNRVRKLPVQVALTNHTQSGAGVHVLQNAVKATTLPSAVGTSNHGLTRLFHLLGHF